LANPVRETVNNAMVNNIILNFIINAGSII